MDVRDDVERIVEPDRLHLVEPRVVGQFLGQHRVAGGSTGLLKRQQLVGKDFPLLLQIEKDRGGEGVIEDIDGGEEDLGVRDRQGVREGVCGLGGAAVFLGSLRGRSLLFLREQIFQQCLEIQRHLLVRNMREIVMYERVNIRDRIDIDGRSCKTEECVTQKSQRGGLRTHLLVHERYELEGDLGVDAGDLEAVGERGEGPQEILAVP